MVHEDDTPIMGDIDPVKKKLRFTPTKEEGLIKTVLDVAHEYDWWDRFRVHAEVQRRLRRDIDQPKVNWVLKEHNLPHLYQ